MSIRLKSGITGGVLVVFGIVLQSLFPESPTIVQVTLLTMLVFAVVSLANYKNHRQHWFWKSMLCVLLIHIVVLLNLRPHFPFPTLGTAILISLPEAILLQGVVILASRTFSN